MTNKEKAEELYLNVEQPTYDDERLAAAFTRGANWKDDQYKKYLEKQIELCEKQRERIKSDIYGDKCEWREYGIIQRAYQNILNDLQKTI